MGFIDRESASKAFSEHLDSYFAKTIFTYKVGRQSLSQQILAPGEPCVDLTRSQCKSWFKRNQEDGRITGLWPGSSVHAQEAFKSPRFEDFSYVQMAETSNSPMAWLGSGLTVAQERDEKTTGYLDTVDIPPAINHGPRPGRSLKGGAGEKDLSNSNGDNVSKMAVLHVDAAGKAAATMPV